MREMIAQAKIVATCFAVLCFIITLLMLINPDLFTRINRLFKKWFSTDKLEKELNRTRDIDAQILNMRKVLAMLTIILFFIFLMILLK
jgi:flagellar biosynthesis protein FlhB